MKTRLIHFISIGILLFLLLGCSTKLDDQDGFGDALKDGNYSYNPEDVNTSSGSSSVDAGTTGGDDSGTTGGGDSGEDVSTESPWSELPLLSNSRGFPNFAVIDDKFYVLASDSLLEIYDLATETWSSGTSLSDDDSDQHSNAVFDGKIYSYSRSHNLGNIYDPSSDSWSFGSSIPDSNGVCSGTLKDKIHVIGGPDGILNIYDPSTDNWTKGSSTNNLLSSNVFCAISDNKLYLMNQEDEDNNKFEFYDPTNDTWQNLSPPLFPRINSTIAALNEKIYLIGGTGSSGPDNLVQIYDIATDTWVLSEHSLPQGGGQGVGSIGFNGKIYLISGRIFLVYDPGTSSTESSTTDAPTVVSQSIEDGATGISVTPTITVTFSKDMDEATLFRIWVRKTGDEEEHESNLSYNSSTKTVEWTSGKSLEFSTNYELIIFEGFSDTQGNSLEKNPSTLPDDIVFRIDFTTEEGIESPWTELPLLSNSKAEAKLAVINDKIYALGGASPSLLEIYDSATETWSTGASLPDDKAGDIGTIADFDGKIYIYASSSSLSDIYDYSSDTWTFGSSIPGANARCGGTINDKIHVVGGQGVLNIYAPLTETWTKGSSTNNQISSGTFCTISDDKLYLMNQKDEDDNKFEVYDPTNDTWQNLSPPLFSRINSTIAAGIVQKVPLEI